MKNTITDAASGLNYKITELKLLCNHNVNGGKVVVVVEGDDDEKIYRRFMDTEKVTFYIAGNCAFIAPILRNLKSDIFFRNKLVGIKDADFDHVLERTYSDLDNFFLTDCHDIEMTILSVSLSSFENIIKAEYGLPDEMVSGYKVMEDIMTLSYLRLYNEVMIVSESLEGINFKGINYGKLYDGDKKIEMEPCLDYVRSICNNVKLKHFPTQLEMDGFLSFFGKSNIMQLTRGHDFVYALQINLKKQCSNERWGYVGLCLMLRNSCTLNEFRRTLLYHNLNVWMTQRSLNLWKVA